MGGEGSTAAFAELLVGDGFSTFARSDFSGLDSPVGGEGSTAAFADGLGGGTKSTSIACSFCGCESDTGSPNIRSAAMTRCRTREAGKARLNTQR